MNKSKIMGTTVTSDSVTEPHPHAKLNKGRYKRKPPRTGADTFRGDWRHQVDAARMVWDKLTEDEILDTEGDEQKLTCLIQERYAITREAAFEQVKNFLAMGCR